MVKETEIKKVESNDSLSSMSSTASGDSGVDTDTKENEVTIDINKDVTTDEASEKWRKKYLL